MVDPDLIVFDPPSSDPTTTQMKVIVATDEVFYQGDFSDMTKYSAGIYVVEVRAWTDNGIDTGYFKEM